jgi:hypothetical protein
MLHSYTISYQLYMLLQCGMGYDEIILSYWKQSLLKFNGETVISYFNLALSFFWEPR